MRQLSMPNDAKTMLSGTGTDAFVTCGSSKVSFLAIHDIYGYLDHVQAVDLLIKLGELSHLSLRRPQLSRQEAVVLLRLWMPPNHQFLWFVSVV